MCRPLTGELMPALAASLLACEALAWMLCIRLKPSNAFSIVSLSRFDSRIA
jgi:hypothetical protein